ncbi:MAG: hypothetical protein KBT45_07610 [Bacteroidales bacterium]|nr:hypothetical protein [Candidatus Colimorpha pelethequi]
MKKGFVFYSALILLFLSMANSMNAQSYNEENALLLHSFRTPQSLIFNPSLFPENNKVYVTLPGAGLHFVSPASLGDFLHYDANQDLTILDFNQLCDQLSESNKLRLGMDVNLLGFGFKINRMFFTFSSRIAADFSMGLPSSTIDFLRKGNIDANGNPIESMDIVDGDLLNCQAYNEIAIGGGYELSKLGLTVGARLKLLNGLLNLTTDQTKIELQTSSDYSNLRANVSYQLNMASVAEFDTNWNPDIHFGDIINPFNSNNGVAFDLGAKYEMGPITISASLINLSAGIHWKQNAYKVVPKNGNTSFEFDGLNMSSLVNGGSINTDSIMNTFKDKMDSLALDRNNDLDYWHYIPTQIYVGANYTFNNLLRGGLTLHGQLDKGLFCKRNDGDVKSGNTFRFNTTLTAGVNVFNWLEVTLGNSFVFDGGKADFFNPGAALVFTPGTVFQIYLVTDYISSIYIVDNKAFNCKIGINLLFGKNKKEE